MVNTIVALIVFIGIAFIPKIPWWGRFVIQIVLGAIVYFPLEEAEFLLPGENTIFGGNAFDMADGVAWISMGVIGFVLGTLASVVSIGLSFRKSS